MEKTPKREEPKKYKASNNSNLVFVSRILKQIERAFTDLECMDTNQISLEMFTDIMTYLGYIGDDIA